MKKIVPNFFLITLFLFSCQRASEQSATALKIAFVMKTLNNPFFIDMQRGAEAAAKEHNVELIVQAAERELDVEKQMQIIENLIQARVRALCVTPSGSREILPALAQANAANIPVFIVDTRLDSVAAAEAGVRYETFIGSDNFEGGKVAGEFLVARFNGNAEVAVLEGIPGHETGDSRLRGFRAALQSAPGMRIIASQTANWERDQGFNVFQNILQAHPNLDALFACNDMMALGAIEALAAAGKAHQIAVLGFDAIDDAREAINAGTMAASVAQSPEEMGRVAVASAVRVLRGEKLPANIPVKIALVKKEDNASVE
jgi:ribose transport system substrate-binding protein